MFSARHPLHTLPLRTGKKIGRSLSRRVDYMVLSHLPAADDAQVYGKSTAAATAPPETDGGKANPNPEQQGGY